MSAIIELYYGTWASLAQMPLMARASIVVLCFLIPAWIIAIFLLPKLLGLFVIILTGILRAVFFLMQIVWYTPMAKRNAVWGQRYNQAVEKNERRWEALARRGKVWRGAKFHIYPLRFLGCYIALLLLIGLPQFLKDKVDERYLPYFSVVHDLYVSLEEGPLNRSLAYSPLVVPAGGAAKAESTPEPPEPLELRLTKAGMAGSNIRGGPGKEYDTITTVWGDAVLYLLDDSNPDWYQVRLEDGSEGWVHSSLVETTETPDNS